MYRNSPIAGWRNQRQNYLLQGVQCVSCKALFYPRKYRCSCSSTNFEPFQFSGNATLISFSQVMIPPFEFIDYTPYCVALVELAEGIKIFTQLADVEFEKLKIGIPLVASFRRYFAAGERGMIFYGIKFIPAEIL